MDPLIWLCLIALVVGLLVMVTFGRGLFSSKSEKPAATAAKPAPTGQRAEMAGGMRRSRNVRSRIAAAQRARQATADTQLQEAEVVEEEGSGEDSDAAEVDGEKDEGLKAFGGKKIGTKKLRKLQEKAEKKAMREQEEARREDQKKRDALKEEERQRELEQEKIRQAEEEEERLRLLEEQKKREHEEYLKLKEAFVVEEEGEEAGKEDEEAKTVRDFIEYIKRHKVVYMEDLAGEFNMKTQEAISRVQTLQESGELSGVVDDRGKFIYISGEELKAVANFIKQRGRVSIVELVSSSNRLINLQPESSVTGSVAS